MIDEIPSFAISIRQPWALLIVNGVKNIENRKWRPTHRGPVLIHASKKIDNDAMKIHRFQKAQLQLGGFIGIATIDDVVTAHSSRWFTGPIGLVLTNARMIKFVPAAGALRVFPISEEMRTEIVKLQQR